MDSYSKRIAPTKRRPLQILNDSLTKNNSWASAAYDDNVDLPVISKALGHTNPQNTLIYLQQIDDLRIQKANRRLLENMKEFSRMIK